MEVVTCRPSGAWGYGDSIFLYTCRPSGAVLVHWYISSLVDWLRNVGFHRYRS